MNELSTSPSRELRRSIRPCIICGSKDCTPVFDFTLDFAVRVRGQTEASMRSQGWDDDTTSTIVKCRQCGCNYVRDTAIPSLAYRSAASDHSLTADSIEERRARVSQKDVYKNYHLFDYQVWVVRMLVQLASTAQKRDIKLLDYGAGGGETSSIARVMGVRDVIAYDPNWAEAIQTHFDSTNFPGIQCVRDKAELPALGPFDAAIFQSAIEHVLDPRAELQTIFDLMAPGGFFYVNNPVMEIDKEIGALRAAKQIRKKDRISYYHFGHFNYMMPRHIEQLIKEVGFEITPMVHYPPVHWAPGHYREYFTRNLKRAIRYTQNLLGLPYDRYFYILRKPV